jgi:hypothetical protein
VKASHPLCTPRGRGQPCRRWLATVGCRCPLRFHLHEQSQLGARTLPQELPPVNAKLQSEVAQLTARTRGIREPEDQLREHDQQQQDH